MGDERSWKPPTLRDSAELAAGRGRSLEPAEGRRVLAHSLRSKLQMPCAQISVL